MEIDHFSHEHPLTFIESEKRISTKYLKKKKKIICSGCQEFCTVPLYACTQCSFYLHKSCAELPRDFQNLFHQQHGPLVLLFDANKSFPCGACSKSCNGFYFHCEVCNFNLHVDCAILMPGLEEIEEEEEEKEEEEEEQLQHFTHLHPLVLVEKKDEIVNRVKCLICGGHCFGPCYGCDPCGIYLHQPCAEFQYPQEFQTHRRYTTSLTHVLSPCRLEPIPFTAKPVTLVCWAFITTIYDYLHPEHPLSLLLRPTNHTTQVEYRCNACCGDCSGLTYRCDLRDFNLHVECTEQVPTIKYESHKHLLLLVENMSGEAKCNGCDKSCDSSVLRCPQCDFNLHVQCGPLPDTIKHKCHVDSLTLVESPVDGESDSDDEFYCDVCEKKRNPRLPIYCCDQDSCPFVAAVSCVMSEVTRWLKGENGDMELRTPEGKFAGKASHDLLTLDQILKSPDLMRLMEEAQAIRRQSKPEVGGKGALTWNDILYSFSTAEHEELKDVLKTKEPEASGNEDNSLDKRYVLVTEEPDVSGDEDKYSFLKEAFTDLVQMINSGPTEFKDFWKKEEKVVNFREYLVPQSLFPILESLFAKHGDVSVGSSLSSNVKIYLFVILCGTIDSMCSTRILDITEDTIINWWKYLIVLLSAGFKIQFAHDHLKKVTKAYLGHKLTELEAHTLRELDTDVTKYSAEVEEMTTKLEHLKFKRERIMSEKSGKKSSLIEECLRAAKQKWKKAGKGLQLNN
uniref:Phorbol-ester/DAG-type domain-containing protein n=1 Tax=Fagus sylvatica TaxID=28930 RepID=A0A2N9FZ82_FAGSY